jgi:hypothetical protein
VFVKCSEHTHIRDPNTFLLHWCILRLSGRPYSKIYSSQSRGCWNQCHPRLPRNLELDPAKPRSSSQSQNIAEVGRSFGQLFQGPIVSRREVHRLLLFNHRSIDSNTRFAGVPRPLLPLDCSVTMSAISPQYVTVIHIASRSY